MFLRRLACSILCLSFIPPLLCLIWVILPSQEPASDTNISELERGHAVTRAYQSYKYFKDRTYDDLHDYVALEFQYEGSSLAINDRKILLGDTASEYPQTIEIDHVAAGVVDGINLPWFNRADACLLSALTGRLQSPDNEGPQVSLQIQRTQDGSSTIFTVVPATRQSSNSQLWLLSMTFDTAFSAPWNSTHIPMFSFPEGSSSPSNTYHIRKRILIVLATLYFNLGVLVTLVWVLVKFATALGIIAGCIWLCGRNLVQKRTRMHDEESGETPSVQVLQASADKHSPSEIEHGFLTARSNQ